MHRELASDSKLPGSMPHREFLKRGLEAWLSRKLPHGSYPASKGAKLKVQFVPTEPSWPGRVEICTAKGLQPPPPTHCSCLVGGLCAEQGFGSEPPAREEMDRLELSTGDSLQLGRATQTIEYKPPGRGRPVSRTPYLAHICRRKKENLQRSPL